MDAGGIRNREKNIKQGEEGKSNCQSWVKSCDFWTYEIYFKMFNRL